MGRSPKKPKQHKITRTTHSAKSLQLQKGSLPHSIVEVVGTLQKAGFEAYIVGGGVRDSLLGLLPKDFDAVTDARPHEIKAIFGGRCRIIGRRFQLAHVYSGREMIEVATFRAPPKDDTHTTDEGMLTRDNVWGTIEQDFARRDFSINALYYQPLKDEVIDFCGALDDVENKVLRLLGDARVRIEEDPVRLLRALRFKAKLGFEFDRDLAAQFHAENWALLEQVSAHRLYDETQKMFGGGYLTPLLPLLFDSGAMASLMTYPPEAPSALMMAVAKNTDRRINGGKSVNPAFVYAVLLWGNYLYQLAKFKKRGLPFHEAQLKAAEKTIDTQRLKTAIPKFAEQFITDIWMLQPKLVNPRIKDIANLERLPKFRAAFDFLVLRESFDDHPLTEPTNGMAAWWQTYQDAGSGHRAMMIEEFGNDVNAPKRRRNRGKASQNPELEQLRELSLRDEVITTRPEPLFVIDDKSAKANKDTIQSTERYAPPAPVFATVTYSEEDFAKLLANDEPYIPSSRHRKRKPSSSLSLVEKAAGLSEEILENAETPKRRRKSTTTKTVTKATVKTAAKAAETIADAAELTAQGDVLVAPKKRSKKQAVEEAADKPKRRRSRKSNAKSKADDDV
ncbi:polynucleotide adenylyltransferase PcnB [Moraxella sp. FZLJ2107]|uniref:polynucleotide adenylyltransferase PcnB n=1 Tax=unclassified Moraxella TaxID=2685852 RepID=UPI0020C85924|nr:MULTISPECIES: polynucleotide adenylyltransferase PcnB [unclassified Moraxella]UTO04310.1 polynucleotide adenylyltransferase PcnB [Moraxella sp. FZLJ2107]UTO23143.1 polynucleotide adenylyltransferase PcnB [Moraxella sp. FZLJ2109]